MDYSKHTPVNESQLKALHKLKTATLNYEELLMDGDVPDEKIVPREKMVKGWNQVLGLLIADTELTYDQALTEVRREWYPEKYDVQNEEEDE